jgi:hypothetical protein
LRFRPATVATGADHGEPATVAGGDAVVAVRGPVVAVGALEPDPPRPHDATSRAHPTTAVTIRAG